MRRIITDEFRPNPVNLRSGNGSSGTNSPQIRDVSKKLRTVKMRHSRCEKLRLNMMAVCRGEDVMSKKQSTATNSDAHHETNYRTIALQPISEQPTQQCGRIFADEFRSNLRLRAQLLKICYLTMLDQYFDFFRGHVLSAADSFPEPTVEVRSFLTKVESANEMLRKWP
ncbi:hypothetical protein T06_331 [Trichinella sp. T6]|nr:hypothetical protein T06_331 [Trichinella sp. T6]